MVSIILVHGMVRNYHVARDWLCEKLGSHLGSPEIDGMATALARRSMKSSWWSSMYLRISAGAGIANVNLVYMIVEVNDKLCVCM